MPISDTIKKLRTEDNKLTQVEFAEKMNCNRQKIADWERGKSTPSADDIVLLCKQFNVSADYLLGLSPTPTNDKDLSFVCEYTGLNKETAILLNKNYQKRIGIRQAEMDLGFQPTTPLIDEKVCDIILLYFNVLQSIINDYLANASELKRGIDSYNKYVDIQKKEFIDNAEKEIKNNEKDDKANHKLWLECEKTTDEITNTRLKIIDTPLNAVNADLFQLQDVMLSYAKSIYDISTIREQAHKIKGDRSIYLYFENIVEDFENIVERGDMNGNNQET